MQGASASPGAERVAADAEWAEMQHRVRWIMRIRWFTIPLLSVFLLVASKQDLALGAADLTSWVSTWLNQRLVPQVALSLASFALNLLYLAMVRQRRNLLLVANLQVGFDALVYTAQVHFTGGAESPLFVLYVIPVLEAAVLLNVRSSLVAAIFSVGLYAAMVWGELSGRIPHVAYFTAIEAQYQRSAFVLLMVMVCFFTTVLVALLSSFLLATIRRQERKLKDTNRALDRKVGELSMLHEVANTLQETTRVDQVLQKILDTLVVGLHIHRAILYLADERRKVLEMKLVAVHPQFAGSDSTQMHVRIPLTPTTVTALAAIQKRAFNVTDPMANPLVNKRLASTIGFNPFAVAPMVVRGRAVGVIGVDRRHTTGALTEEELRLLAIFANQAGLTIHNAQLERGDAGLRIRPPRR